MQFRSGEIGGDRSPVRGRVRSAGRVGAYLIIAAFVIAILAGSLFVYHRFMTHYRQSAELGRLLEAEIEGYHRLETSIARVVTPGRDIFASADPALETERHRVALAAYRDTVGELRHTFRATDNPAPVSGWPTVLEDIDSLVTELSSAGRETMALYSAGKTIDAIGPMVEMNRLHGEIRRVILPLQTRAQTLQRSNLDRQLALAAEMRITEYLIGALVALATLALVVYGYRLSRGIDFAGTEPSIRRRDRPQVQTSAVEFTEPGHAQEELDVAKLKAEPDSNPRPGLLATASHDLRQPLHAISLYLDLLSDRIEDPEALATVDAAIASSESLRSMLDSLLEISKLDAGMVEARIAPVPVLDIFDQLAAEAAPRAAENDIDIRIVPTNIWVESDPILLQAILRKLLSNALRYTQAGRILVGARRRGGRVRIEVWDTGPGIPDDMQSRIFEEFFQAREPVHGERPGIGLGLAIIDRLARLLNHDVAVRSRPGRGSMFGIELAVAMPPKLDTEAVQRCEFPDKRSTMTVLLIDDNDGARTETATMLSDWGCEVLVAAATKEAAVLVGGCTEPPDIILIDLPSRGIETGIEVVRCITRVTGRHVPALIMTAESSPQRRQDLMDCNIMILNKPIEPDEIRQALEGLVSKRGVNGADKGPHIAVSQTLTEGLT